LRLKQQIRVRVRVTILWILQMKADDAQGIPAAISNAHHVISSPRDMSQRPTSTMSANSAVPQAAAGMLGEYGLCTCGGGSLRSEQGPCPCGLRSLRGIRGASPRFPSGRGHQGPPHEPCAARRLRLYQLGLYYSGLGLGGGLARGAS